MRTEVGRSVGVIFDERDFFPHYSKSRETFDPRLIQTDAERLQFKSGGNGHGVTRQLLSIGNWEDAFSGIVYVWETKSGELFIADGHQRLGLAQRLIHAGADPEKVVLHGLRFREADGWNVQAMRVFAAAKNIAEGGESTKAMDVAKLLRNGGPVAYLDTHISTQRKSYKDGKSLANLSEHCFKLILNNVIPEIWGIAVGERIEDHDEQLSIIEFLKQHRPNSENITDLVEEARAAGFSEGKTQVNLFGQTDLQHALIAERIAVFKFCQKQLKGIINAWNSYNEHIMEFRSCGSEVSTNVIRSRLQLRETMLSMISQARRKGEPLSLCLTKVAVDHNKGTSLPVAAAVFMSNLELFSRPFVRAAEPDPEENFSLLGETPLLPMALAQDTGKDGSQLGMF